MKLSIKPESYHGFLKSIILKDYLLQLHLMNLLPPDGGDPHDHPFDFITHILSGGYTERVYNINDRGEIKINEIERRPGTSHYVKATDIHQIIHISTGHCVTLMMPQSEHVRATCFYRFIDGIAYRRLWNKRKFIPLTV